MRTRRLFLALALTLLLAVPTGLAQDGPSVSSEARSGERSLSDASPVAPGDPITVVANVTTSAEGEWRAFVNASVGNVTDGSAERSWSGGQAVELQASLQAPDAEGTYSLNWTVVVQSRADENSAWTDEQRTDEREAFQVRQRAPPPNASDVNVDVRTAGGDGIGELGNLSPNENVILEGEVELPERENTHWNVTMRVFVNGTRVASGQQQPSQAGTLTFPLQFSAPGAEGEHEIRWEVVVEWRDASEEAWTELTTQEDQATFAVERLAPEPGPGIPWLWILIAGAVLVGGGAGAYYLFRPPKQIKGEPRSQAMQDLEGGGAATAEPEEPEVHPQVKILEARAEDLRRMIELARQRYEEDEITEHQFEQIKERKEAELEEVEEEIEEYRQEGGQQ